MGNNIRTVGIIKYIRTSILWVTEASCLNLLPAVVELAPNRTVIILLYLTGPRVAVPIYCGMGHASY